MREVSKAKYPSRFVIASAAFLVCLGVGASLSLLTGLESRVWLPAGVVVSTLVAWFVVRNRSTPV
jgi:hypothetical protein